MAEYTESDSQYVRGRIEGYLHGVAQHEGGTKSFDRDRWQALYGSRVIYNGFPAWPSEEARAQGDEPVVLCDWEKSTETKYLKQAVDLPSDRPGTMVFEDGTTVIARSERPIMFTLDGSDTKLIERWQGLMLEMLREAHDYYDNTIR